MREQIVPIPWELAKRLFNDIQAPQGLSLRINFRSKTAKAITKDLESETFLKELLEKEGANP